MLAYLARKRRSTVSQKCASVQLVAAWCALRAVWWLLGYRLSVACTAVRVCIYPLEFHSELAKNDGHLTDKRLETNTATYLYQVVTPTTPCSFSQAHISRSHARSQAHIHTRTHTRTQIHTHTHTHTQTHTHTSKRTHTHIYTHARTHTRTHAHTHTHNRTHTRTHTRHTS